MELNRKQLENLQTLVCEWVTIRERLAVVANLASGLGLTTLGEEANWSSEKISRLIPLGLLDLEV